MGRKAQPPRIEVDDKGTWYVHWSESGRTKRQTLGTTDLETAKVRFAEWLVGAIPKPQPKSTAPKIGECWYHYYKHAERTVTAPATIATYGNNLLPYFGNMHVDEITEDDIHDYIAKRTKGRIGASRTPAAAGTIRSELTKLRACMNFMVKKVTPLSLRIPKTMVPYFALPEDSPPRAHVAVDDGMEKLLAAALPPPGQRMSRLERYVWLGFETGARDMAMRQLKWEQVDFEQGLINFLPKGKRQNRIKRKPIVPISERLMPVLRRMWDERTTDYVLDKPTTLARPFTDFVTKNGFPDLTPHSMRHSFATQLVQMGIQVEAIAAMLGDTVKTVMDTYVHLQPRFLKNAMEARNHAVRRRAALSVDRSTEDANIVAQNPPGLSINNQHKERLDRANKPLSA